MKRKLTISIVLSIIAILAVYLLYLNSDPVIKDSDLSAQIITEDNFEEENKWGIDINKVHYLENIPLVYIEGNGYKAGLQHGKLLKQQIKESIHILKNEILQTNTFVGFFVDQYLIQQGKKFDKHIPQIYREEIKGIAEGAEVSYNDILLINVFDDLMNLVRCSSIAVAKNDKNSLFFHARNLDYPIDALAKKNIVFHYLDEQFISVAFPGYIGALSATNYDGISLSSHTSPAQKDEIGVPTGIIYREIMEEAEDIADAESILKNNKRTIGNNLLVSSLNENQTAVFEITVDKVVKILGDHGVATNHFVSQELSGLNKLISNSEKRYNYLENFFQDSENIDVEMVKEVMSFYDGNEEYWSSIASKGTVQSVIFIPEQKVVYVAKGIEAPVNKEGYVKYAYGEVIPN
jgi:hypothetical protein